LGDHLRAKRIESGLTQKQLCTQLGCGHLSLGQWELNQHQPSIRHIPKIVEFLGFDPFPEPTDPVAKLRKIRMLNGWNYKKTATMVGVDPCSLTAWERGEHHPTKDSLVKIMCFIASLAND